jgi:hypothetical protein
MDLLVQVTTSNKINPGGHIVQVRNERGIELQYKPSTPIGKSDFKRCALLFFFRHFNFFLTWHMNSRFSSNLLYLVEIG